MKELETLWGDPSESRAPRRARRAAKSSASSARAANERQPRELPRSLAILGIATALASVALVTEILVHHGVALTP
jgi:hypothetical protein